MCISVGWLAVETEVNISADNAVGGGNSLAWVVAIMMPLQGSPQALRSEA
jgi:hypothetical protein